ncbi:hypothetical protein ETN89_19700 (plasmid) [Photobacterium damselae subsp. damselae]|uniref:hypothetical protein n=1 Tax=Photobacterium damselae TaxID=38293 RepID=UPI000A2FB985|nr:hypothetical protein [Photobacterium damselae]ARR51809.1 hypothetical protein CAY62_20550 [Photobacterium damselae subsp. damselae]QAY37493.1 hypothetical protein ETN89_19700 [Photobacterium damselae subsp. damselae]
MQLHEHYNQQRFSIVSLLDMAKSAKKYNIILCYALDHSEENRRYTLAKLLLTTACPTIMAEIPSDVIRFEVENALRQSILLQDDVTILEGRLTYPIKTPHA